MANIQGQTLPVIVANSAELPALDIMRSPWWARKTKHVTRRRNAGRHNRSPMTVAEIVTASSRQSPRLI